MSDAAARREARRRRILENADNRLKRISNIHRKIESETDETEIVAPDVQCKTKPDHPACINYAEEPVVNNVEIEYVRVENEVKKFIDLDLEKEVVHLEETVGIDEVSDCGKSFYGTFIVLLLGLSVRYLNLIFSKFEFFVGIDLSYLHIDKIFLPLLGYECYVLLLARPKYEENVTMNLIMLMNNINGKKVQPLLRLLNLIINVHKDMAIYFFAFILLDLVFALVSA
ncbi:PREDICTED: uncharacterized protein LOC108567097 [Nicrophorus vespilloides]|uniref:Uncharacterized protein LOC108567097 n=1 Tax=Nicrophorus vespilloides TaxID=110193 RepID=A0ABM1N7P9_NICVS|nr:PREDICTED: uncharacterized protein LOC108567097 [Nicrophorus vespilloides]